MNTYEIMFLFDPTFGANWSAVETEIHRLMERASAQIIVTKRLEERRLAFEIKKRKRGLYVLTYFRTGPDRITGLDRDIRLSENILRALILRADGISEAKMHAATLSGVAQEARPAEETPAPSDQGKPPSDSTASSASDNEEIPELVVSALELDDAAPGT